MEIVLFIIVVFFLCGIKDWIEDHLFAIGAIALFVAAWHFIGPAKTILITVILVGLVALAFLSYHMVCNYNEKALKRVLSKKCRALGYMKSEDWKKLLPEFAERHYLTSFDQITSMFAADVEQEFFVKSKDLSWIDPYTQYLKSNIMASIYQLEELPNDSLNITHKTPNGQLIYDALSTLQKVQTFKGAPLLEIVESEPDAVRKMIPGYKNTSATIPEYYLKNFKLSDKYISAKAISTQNFESEEFSLDELDALSG